MATNAVVTEEELDCLNCHTREKLRLETWSTGLAEFSRAIGTGPRVAMGESVDKVALMIKKRTRRDAIKVVDIVGDAKEIVVLTGNEALWGIDVPQGAPRFLQNLKPVNPWFIFFLKI